MNSIWRSLLWKEWREHRGMLAAILATCAVLPALFGLGGGVRYFDLVAMLFLFLVPAFTIFIAGGIAAGEQARHTIGFLQALPTPMWKPGVAKLFLAVLTASAPSLVAIIIVLGWWLSGMALGPYRPDGSLVAAFATMGWVAVGVLVWGAAAGVNRGDEVRAGLWGLIFILGCWAAIGFAAYCTTDNFNGPWPRSLLIAAAAAPGGVIAIISLTSAATDAGGSTQMWEPAWPFAISMLLTNGALAVWFVWRFGRISAAKMQSVERMPSSLLRGWLSAPRWSPLTSIIWKQVRETAPLVALGSGIIAVVSFALAIMIGRVEGASFPELLKDVITVTWLSLGFGVAVITGIGIFLDDLRPELHTFWRSRPINVDQWFTAKVITGLLATVPTISAAALLVQLITQAITDAAWSSSFGHGQFLELVALGMIFHVAAYLFAVAATVLLRHAVYAAILTTTAAVVTLVVLDWIKLEPARHVATAIALGAASSAGAVALAWQAVRRDWGWKG
jgi:hypothetical protein